MIDTHITRRRSIAIGGTILSAGVAGLALSTDPATAQVDIGDGLVLEDAEFSVDDPPEAIWCLIGGSYSYRVDVDPSLWEVFLLLYQNGNSEAIQVVDGPATAREDSGTYALRGDLTTSSFYAPEDFVVPEGDSSRTLTIDAEVAFVVRDASDAMLVQDRAADSSTVVVKPGGEMSQVGGSGEIVLQETGDPTPALPEV